MSACLDFMQGGKLKHALHKTGLYMLMVNTRKLFIVKGSEMADLVSSHKLMAVLLFLDALGAALQLPLPQPASLERYKSTL